ncbi:MAG TPA: phosphoribosylformylglycinamidine synthase I [Anaerolineaceae bacterium]|nr:phosphoribosylformylglycinamidine synthase I [Anaerolineaceae bacterium]
MKPRALVLQATGTNRDHDAALAIELAGGAPEIVHLNQLRRREKRWSDYQMLVLPGGFSYADALGAGRLLALDLTVYFAGEVRTFVDSGRPVIGICNGFQALVKAGILPGSGGLRRVSLTFNSGGCFECRWVTLLPTSRACIWTRGLEQMITCPVAHGEGNFTVSETNILETLDAQEQVALRYVRPDGTRPEGEYPFNPNGSAGDIAGICNPQGNVLGLMPHPENHVFAYQNPDKRTPAQGSGLALFANGVAYAGQI